MSEGTVKRTHASAILYTLFALPLVLHLLALARDVRKHGAFPFGWPDLLVLAAVLGYAAAGVLLLRRREWGVRFLLVVYAVALPALALEAALFLAMPKGLPWPPVHRTSTAADTMPGVQGEIRFTVNRMGLRAPDAWPPDRGDRILCLGGSTTECLYVTDEKSWPWLLGSKLSSSQGRQVLVASAAQSGQFTLHHEYQLAHYARAGDFGRVVVLCGINDAGTFLRANYEERKKKVWREALTVPPMVYNDRAYYMGSMCLRLLFRPLRNREGADGMVEQDARGAWYAQVRARRRELLAANPIRSAPCGLPGALQLYRENLLGIAKACRENRQEPIFLTQPTLYAPDMPPELSGLLWEFTGDGAYTAEVLAEVNEAYNRTLLDVCEEEGIACVDLAAMLPKDETVFYDDCHFNIAGCERVAGVLAERLGPAMGARGGTMDDGR